MGLLKKRKAKPDRKIQRRLRSEKSIGPSLQEKLEEALRSHSNEISSLTTGEAKTQVLMTWRKTIDEEAHDYADAVVSHPNREEIMKLEVDTIMTSFYFGLMAKQGWVAEGDALQGAYIVGRAMRDRLRCMGVRLDALNPSLGAIIDEALSKIVMIGL